MAIAFKPERPHIVEKAYTEEPEQDSIGMPPLSESIQYPSGIVSSLLPIRQEYQAYSKLLSPEGYEGFHDACFWGMLSMIAARRVYADLTERQYTPLYIALAARTSLYAKTTTSNVVSKILYDAGMGHILGNDRTTPEKLMSDMAGWIPKDFTALPEADQAEEKLRIASAGQLGWINDEFGKFVKGMLKESSTMSTYADILLTLDGCPPRYRNATISRAKEPIIAPYIAMIGNMTLSNVRNNAKSGAEFWSDGFWARFTFITPPPNTYIDAPFGRGERHVPLLLRRTLQEWHERLGVPLIDIEEEISVKTGAPTGVFVKKIIEERKETGIEVSLAAHTAWARYRSELKAMIASMPNEDLDGSYDRLPTKALRVATIIASLLNSSSIEMSHWILAQEVAESWRYSLHQFYNQVNAAATVNIKTTEELILEKMRLLEEKNALPASARDIARLLHKDSREIKPFLSSMTKDGEIEEIKGRQAPRYQFPDSNTGRLSDIDITQDMPNFKK